MLTAQEVGAMVGLSSTTIRRRVLSGELKGYDFSGAYRFKLDDVETWIKSRLYGQEKEKATTPIVAKKRG